MLKYTELASVTNEERVPELNLKESSKRRVDLSLAEERQVSGKHLSYPKSSVDGTLKYENVYFWRLVKKDLSHSANQKGFFLKACTFFTLKD